MMDPSSQGKIVSLPVFTKERRGRVASAYVRVAKTGNGPQWLDELYLTPRAGRQAEQEIDGLGRNPQPRVPRNEGRVPCAAATDQEGRRGSRASGVPLKNGGQTAEVGL